MTNFLSVCLFLNIYSASYGDIGAFINFLSVVFFDALVLSLTIYRTARLAKRAKESGIKGALSFVLFRDG